MTTTPHFIRQEAAQTRRAARGNGLYLLGGVAALLIVATALAELAITFLPGGYAAAETVTDWFTLLQAQPFMGLRNLGLLNIIMVAFELPLQLALYAAHRKVNPAFALLALVGAYMGAAVFYATNRAFPMLDLSARYAVATSDAQRAMLAAAGQAMLAVGESHTPGTFLAFCLSVTAGILMGLVMLRGKVFPRAAAYAGIIGFGLLLIFEVVSSFAPSYRDQALIVAMVGGLANMAWNLLIARRLLQLHRSDPASAFDAQRA